MVIAILDRIARHWFLFILVFGIYCAMIAGVAGVLYGVPDLFLDDPALANYGQLALFSNGPIFLSQIAATTLIGLIWLMVSLIDAHHARNDVVHGFMSHLTFLLPRVLVCSLFPLAAVGYALGASPGQTSLADFGRAMVGSAVGIVISVLCLAGAHLLKNYFNIRVVYFFMALVFAFLVVLTLIPKLVPAISIAIVLGWLTLIYGLVGLLPDGWRPVAFVGLIALITIGNGTMFKYEFDGISDRQGQSYYAQGNNVRLYENKPGGETELSEAGMNIFKRSVIRRRLKSVEGSGQALLKPVDVLKQWKSQTGEDKPKLVVLSTSGGAYRAAFWTALVLDKLEAESGPGGRLPGFDKHIVLVTGASGGMVSAAYLVAGRQADGSMAFDSIEAQLEADIVASAKADRFGTRFPIPRDSLSIVTQQLVQRDLFHLFNPVSQSIDRGKVLESQWSTLDITFDKLKLGEAQGWRPSIIVSPMLVETGQPLLISNLNLSEIRVEAPKPMVFQGRRDFAIPLPSKTREQRLKETVEFFKMFPGSNKSFKLNTAARMSASFAFISPAVDLPTIPARRVVDAGYYDNYGVSMAIAYLKQKEIKKWIVDNTSGVVVVQIRAYPSVVEGEDGPASSEELNMSGRKKREKVQCEQITPSQILLRQPGWLERAFQWITSPFEGQEMARQASMLFRNNQELRLLQSLYPDDFLHTVAFENSASISLNWYLPQHEMGCLRDELKKVHIEDAVNQLVRFWSSSGLAAQ